MHAWLIAALVVAWVLVAALVGLLFALVNQHGKLVIRLEELQERVIELANAGRVREPAPELPEGLPVGAEAPAFELPDLTGTARSIESYRGRPLVLLFFSPGCGYCLQMSPRLGELPAAAPAVLMVTQGVIEENRRLADAHGWRFDVVHEDDWKVVQSYETYATPSAYLIDAEGRIASPLRTGMEDVLELVERPGAIEGNGHASGNGHDPALVSAAVQESGESEARARGLRTRDTSESRLVRDGLPAGSIAPTFVLPDLAGTMRSLADFHGRRVLLVFSDVNCGPCDELAPKLVDLHAQASDDLQVVVISRGDPEQNRSKAVSQGWTFPVLLQRSWEVSKQYGMFGTPIGFLIGTDGVIERDVAVGGDAIVELAAQA